MIHRVFPFCNELDVLEIKLATEYSFVDKFYILESNKTHSGNLKPLHFELNKDRYSQWLDKIVHIVVDMDDKHKYPYLITRRMDYCWENESFQRNAIALHLTEYSDDDIFICSDADEIIDEDTFNKALNIIKSGKFDLVRVNQPLYNHKFNLFHTYSSSLKVMSGKKFKSDKLTNIIVNPSNAPEIVGGWHFSYIFDRAEDILLKFKSFSHALEKTWLNDSNEAVAHMYESMNVKKVEIDDTFPKYLLENLDKFNKHIFNE